MRRRKQEQGIDNGTAEVNDAADDGSAVESRAKSDGHRSIANQPPQHRSSYFEGLRLFLLLWRITGCIAFVYGMYLGQTELCTHQECDMTYSMRMFLHLDMKPSRLVVATGDDVQPNYRLFKFIDQRDPRHKQFQRQPQPLKGNDWCLDPQQTTAVLYVPGHGGSYQQSRSLGAHGLQLTAANNPAQKRRVLQAIQNNEWTGNATDLESFVFDVYALDFGEEGAGLHGRLVELQSAMVADSVEFLVQTCHLESVIVVAHSIGGYAVRLALFDYPQLRSVVHNVITLATPHLHPVLSIELSLHRIHARMEQEDFIQNNVALVSIGGGLRDEMIPPHLCRASQDSVLNVASTDIVVPGSKMPPLLGMDHRAIVWCYNLLLPLRQIIFTLRTSDSRNARDRLRSVAESLGLPEDYDYLDSVRNEISTFFESFGWWRSNLAELGLLYRLETLVGLYSVSSALYAIVGLSPLTSCAVLFIAPALVSTSAYYSLWGSLCIQSTVANTLFVLLYLTSQIVSKWVKTARRLSAFSMGSISFVFFTGVLFAIKVLLSKKLPPCLGCLGQMCVLSMVPTVLVLFLSWNTSSFRKNVYVAWILVTLPLLASGLFYATFVLQIPVPTIDLVAVITPTALLPILSNNSGKDRPTSVPSSMIFATVLVSSCAVVLAPGTVTVQFVLLPQIFVCLDICFQSGKLLQRQEKY